MFNRVTVREAHCDNCRVSRSWMQLTGSLQGYIYRETQASNASMWTVHERMEDEAKTKIEQWTYRFICKVL